MQIQVASDLHLDINGTISGICSYKSIHSSILNSRGKSDTVLILAGDICNPRFYSQLLDVLSPLWRHIIIVPGNHEFYGWSIAEGLDSMKTSASNYSNVSILDKATVEIDGITFIGAIGWAPTKQIPNIERFINDFSWIKDFKTHTHRCQELHDESMEWLRSTLIMTETPKVVVTHFGQLSLPVPNKFIGSLVNSYFITGALDDCSDKPELFIHGHTHVSYSIKRNSYGILCNPLGYGTENLQYSPNLIHTL